MDEFTEKRLLYHLKLARFTEIDDAETYASQIRADADKRKAAAREEVESFRKQAMSIRDQGIKLKSQRDSLNDAVKGLEIYSQGATNVEKLKEEIQGKKRELHEAVARLESESAAKQTQLTAEINSLAEELNRRKNELGLIEEQAEMQSFGLYEPRFNFDHSEQYRDAMKSCVSRQKQMVKEKTAGVCSTTWSVEGSESKGQTMINRSIKLMLRAVNGECDAIISKVNHNNVDSSEQRIVKCFEVINKLGESNHISFDHEYQQLKLNELRLNYEYMLKKQEEKEREREHREQMREEERASKEIEKAKTKAEKEEQTKEKALAKAREQMAAEHGAHNAKLQELVAKLENELSEAIDRKAKATARAQLTRSGHVYVLSNIGTMGEGVFKIGMTRRLEPLERVKELGDASVPFPFDVHAMIYSEDAPALENALHKRFDDQRVNLVNLRREYFRVGLEEIIDAVAEEYGLITFKKVPDAEQYRDSEKMREELVAVAAG